MRVDNDILVSLILSIPKKIEEDRSKQPVRKAVGVSGIETVINRTVMKFVDIDGWLAAAALVTAENQSYLGNRGKDFQCGLH